MKINNKLLFGTGAWGYTIGSILVIRSIDLLTEIIGLAGILMGIIFILLSIEN